ncbi:hypothetical protein M514_02887 [Trichuris suis]|uniref:Uncharacterized protein n=1 Tax=Trichuris suis TaxID=68888 RepID=A0A085MFW3_9BILA|nr:hypothetical protein M513_02887 [Trichuris suis]KFD66635.1 hypothetical protein M514_02887 [Trichuris suis]
MPFSGARRENNLTAKHIDYIDHCNDASQQAPKSEPVFSRSFFEEGTLLSCLLGCHSNLKDASPRYDSAKEFHIRYERIRMSFCFCFVGQYFLSM